MGKVMNNLDALKAAKGKSAASPAAASGAGAGSGMKSEKIFNMMAVYLSRGEGKAEVEKVQSVF